MAEWWQRQRAALLWCALAGSVAVALKCHFCAAAASELQWMLHPLAWLLQAATGWGFERNSAGEWQCPGAGIVLVKACAGINFMVLSFLGWCWMWRPVAPWTPFQWPLHFGGALGCAWLLALGVNTLRIVLIVRFQSTLEHWLEPADAHRLLGLMTYLPALCLQGMLADRDEPARAVLIASCLYAFLMLGLPLAGGSAAADPRLFAAHAAESLAVLMPLLGIACWRHNCRAHRFRGS